MMRRPMIAAASAAVLAAVLGAAQALAQSNGSVGANNQAAPVCRKLAALQKQHAFQSVSFALTGDWVILPVQTIPAVRLTGMFFSWLVYTPLSGGNTRLSTKGWDDLDDTEHGIYPSSRSAWMHQNLSDGSSESNS